MVCWGLPSRRALIMMRPMKALRWMLASVVVVILAGPMVAEEAVSPGKGLGQSVRPGINKKFLDPDLKVDDWLKRFEVEIFEHADDGHSLSQHCHSFADN